MRILCDKKTQFSLVSFFSPCLVPLCVNPRIVFLDATIAGLLKCIENCVVSAVFSFLVAKWLNENDPEGWVGALPRHPVDHFSRDRLIFPGI